MRESSQHSVETLLGSRVTSHAPVSGGCINEAFHCHLDDGREVFVKANQGCDPRLFETEAQGLAWLAEAGALPVPKSLGHSAEVLILEYLPMQRPVANFEPLLGRGLATLHKFGAPSFGWKTNNFLATLVQDNQPEETWSTFYSERRLRPLLRQVIDSGRAPSTWSARFEALFAKMPDIAGSDEPPSRLHGDLWSGNLHQAAGGIPALIDPAVYGGHREIDLAMLQLFGSPGSAFFAAYDEVWPRAAGYQERVPLYQLYPLLAHVALFGGSYVGSCEQALAHWF